jgi:hypothetical protein
MGAQKRCTNEVISLKETWWWKGYFRKTILIE